MKIIHSGHVSGDKLRDIMSKNSRAYFLTQEQTDALLRPSCDDSHLEEQDDNIIDELKVVYVIIDNTTKDIIGIFKNEFMARKMTKQLKDFEIKAMRLDIIYEHKKKFTVKMLKEELLKYPDDLEVHIQYQDAGGTYEGTGNIYDVTKESNHLVLS